MEQVPKWDIGVSGLLDRDAGASCSPGGLGARLVQVGVVERAPADGSDG